MRWCRYRSEGVGFGIIEDDTVLAVSGTPLGEFALTGARFALADVELLAPIIPGTFYAVGLNYRSHIRHVQEHGMASARVPERPEIGYRANNALVGSGAAVVKPADCEGRFETEAELVAVVGRPLRRCTRDEAQAAMFGWTIGNDVSARDWQHQDRTFWRSKNSDTFKPMGPWIETDVDPMRSRTTIDVNGERRADFDTGDMVFDPYDYLCEMSRYLTISPGDVVWMGTDGVVAMAPGDTVDITISGIGTLSNPVRAEMPGGSAADDMATKFLQEAT